MATNLTILATFTKNGDEPATGLTLAEISLYLTSINKSTGAVAVVWDGTQVPTVEVTNCGAYARILGTADLNTYDYSALARYTGATALDRDYVSAATGQAEAIVMQMAADSLNAAALAADAVTEIVNAVYAAALEGRTYEEIIKDIWAQVVGDFLADDATDPTSIVYDGPDGATQITHALTDTTRTVS